MKQFYGQLMVKDYVALQTGLQVASDEMCVSPLQTTTMRSEPRLLYRRPGDISQRVSRAIALVAHKHVLPKRFRVLGFGWVHQLIQISFTGLDVHDGWCLYAAQHGHYELLNPFITALLYTCLLPCFNTSSSMQSSESLPHWISFARTCNLIYGWSLVLWAPHHQWHRVEPSLLLLVLDRCSSGRRGGCLLLVDVLALQVNAAIHSEALRLQECVNDIPRVRPPQISITAIAFVFVLTSLHQVAQVEEQALLFLKDVAQSTFKELFGGPAMCSLRTNSTASTSCNYQWTSPTDVHSTALPQQTNTWW